MMVPNICGFSVWKLLLVTLQAPTVLWWLLVYLEIYCPWRRINNLEGCDTIVLVMVPE
jgi:hypothetical protein